MSQRWLKAYNVSITAATEELHGTAHTSASCSAIQERRRWSCNHTVKKNVHIYYNDLSAFELSDEKEKHNVALFSLTACNHEQSIMCCLMHEIRSNEAVRINLLNRLAEVWISQTFKAIVHPKIKINWKITQVIQDVNMSMDFQVRRQERVDFFTGESNIREYYGLWPEATV